MGQPGGPYVTGAAYTHGAGHAPIAVGNPTESRRDSNGWQPPKRGIPPLMLGVGLGLFVVTLLALGLTIWGDTNEPRNSVATVRAQLPAPTPAATVSSMLEAAQPAPAPAPTSTSRAVVSSVAAETVAPRRSSHDKAALPAQSSRKAGSIAAPGPPSKAPPPPAPGKAPSADLGF
jgi:hypothetical protein